MDRSSRLGGGGLALALVLVSVPLAAQAGHAGHGAHGHEGMQMPETGLRAELIRDIEQLEAKYLGLAEAMAERFAWSPGEGVRSVGQVFGHVAMANFMIPNSAGIESPEKYRGQDGMAAVRGLEHASAADLLPELRHSFMHARHAIARLTDAELDETTRLFGREATKRGVVTLLVAHMHEHLGQAIAYARMNGVTPPWSQGG